MARISAGEIDQSEREVPALTKSLSCTRICLDRGTRYCFVCPSFDSMMISRLPRLVHPRVTPPSYSVTQAGLDGFLASKNPVNSGKPQGIPCVLLAVRGVFTSP